MERLLQIKVSAPSAVQSLHTRIHRMGPSLTVVVVGMKDLLFSILKNNSLQRNFCRAQKLIPNCVVYILKIFEIIKTFKEKV